MPKPKCPQCGSTNVVPSLAKNSHDNCVACGYSDFVAKFYPEVAEHHKPGDRVQTNGNFGEPFLQSAKTEDVLRQDRKPNWWENRKSYWWEND